jgi:signal transduction histidine kinase
MSIRSKLTIIFLAIATIPLLFVSALTFVNFKNSLETNRLTQLKDLSIFRADRIEAYFAGLKGDIEIAEGFYNIQKNLPVMTRLAGRQNNSEFVAAKKMLFAQLWQMQSVSDMTDIMLVSPEGKVVYSNSPRHYLKNLSTGINAEQKAFSQGRSGVYFSDIYFDKTEDNRFEMLVAAPATGFNGALIGVIVFEIDMTPVYKLIQDVTGLGTTGEVLVARKTKTGNQVEFLNPLRHDPKAALTRKANIGDASGFPIQQAVQGKTGAGLAIDYRGKQVIAAWRYIPSMDWGLVAKIDTREAFADVTNLRNLVLLILSIVFALSGIMAFSIAQSISGPIKRLSEGAAIIGSGNLDHKLGTDQKDEIGQLSRSFDKMTHDLKTITASRDELDREITARKQTEASLLQTTDDLTRSNKDLEQFAYVASHDLQEPLRAVAGFVELLKQELKSSLNAKTTEYIDFSIDGAKRMQSLINGLLEYSRIGTRGKKATLTDANVSFNEAIARLQISIKESGAKITAGDLPRVYFDEVQLSQLFQNLIGNAIKFRGEQAPQVHVNADRLDAGWRFSVTDNGIGIEEQYAHKIFMIFQRLHSREKYPGTGIGLAICKRIVERHNGKIWVKSAPGSGSTFYFTIPDKGENA